MSVVRLCWLVSGIYSALPAVQCVAARGRRRCGACSGHVSLCMASDGHEPARAVSLPGPPLVDSHAADGWARDLRAAAVTA
jgi:hypothetical protein